MSSPFANIGRNQNANGKKYNSPAIDSRALSTAPIISAPAPKQKDGFSSFPPSTSDSPSSFLESRSPFHPTPRRLYSNAYESSQSETPRSSQYTQGLDNEAVLDNYNHDSKSIFALDNKIEMSLTHAGKTAVSPSTESRQKNIRRPSWWRTMQMKVSKPTDGSSRYIRKDYSHRAQRKVLKRLSEESDLAQQTSLSASSKQRRDTRRPAKSSHTLLEQQLTESDVLQRQQQIPQQDRLHSLRTLLELINKYPALPNTLSSWAQFLLNSFIIASIMYILFTSWSTIRSDVDKKASVVVADLLAEMTICANYYISSNCADKQVPAIQSLCQNWERCMNQDPQHLGRAKLSAHTLADIINGFIEPISYKAIFLSMVFMIVLITAPNLVFSSFREKAYQQQHDHYYRSGNDLPKTPYKESSEKHLEWLSY